MRIVSWNVNGLRACAKKGFLQVLQRQKIDIMALQEVRAFPEQLPANVLNPRGWHTVFSPATRPDSGVAIYSRVQPIRVETSLGEARFDDEGRFLLAQFGACLLPVCTFRKAVVRIEIIVESPTKWIFTARCLSGCNCSARLALCL